MSSPVAPPARARRRIGWMVLCFACASAISWVQAALAGTPSVDHAHLPAAWRLGLLALFGALAAASGHHYAGAIREAAGGNRRGLLALTLLLHAVAATALPFTSNDLFSNLANGRMVLHGLNPYLHGPVALGPDDPFARLVGPMWIAVPTDYGPLAIALATAAAAGGRVSVAMALFKIEMLACSVAAVVLAFRWCRDRGERGAATFLGFACNPLLVWEVSAQAHNDGAMVLAMLAGVLLAHRSRPLRSLIALTVAFYLKFAAAPLFGLFLVERWRHRRRQALGAAALAAALGVGLYAPFWQGAATLSGTLGMLVGGSARTTRSVADFALDLAKRGGGSLPQITWLACSVVSKVTVVWLALRAIWRARSRDAVFREGFVVLFAWLLTAAWFQPWYALWLLPLVPVLAEPRLLRATTVFTTLLVVQYGVPLEPVTHVAINVLVAWLALRDDGASAR